MSQDELEKRIRTLEIRAAMMLGTIATLAICCVAFLGFEYYRIPHQIQKQIEDKAGTDTWELLTKVVNKAKRMEGKSVRVFENLENGDFVDLPPGTEKEDWVAFILPVEIGLSKDGEELEEHTPEENNALMSFKLRLVDREDGIDGWKAEVLYRYKYGGGWGNIKNLPGKSKVLLVPR